MSIWGKILGGAAGFALGGPLGALIGVAAGYAVDRIAESAAPPDGDQTRSIAFTIAVIALGAKMAKADGVVTRDEISAFKRVFKIPPEEESKVSLVFNLARRDTGGFEAYARQIAQMFHDRPMVLEDLLLCLFHIAKADGSIHVAELDFLRKVATIFNMDETQFERLRAAELGPDMADPYHILGVERAADDATLKAAYRKLVRENHPDLLIAQGMPQEFITVATEKLAAINAAYERVAKERRLS